MKIKIVLLLLLGMMSTVVFADQKIANQNAVWIMSSWMEKFDAQKTQQLAHDMKAYNIGILYPRLC